MKLKHSYGSFLRDDYDVKHVYLNLNPFRNDVYYLKKLFSKLLSNIKGAVVYSLTLFLMSE